MKKRIIVGRLFLQIARIPKSTGLLSTSYTSVPRLVVKSSTKKISKI